MKKILLAALCFATYSQASIACTGGYHNDPWYGLYYDGMGHYDANGQLCDPSAGNAGLSTANTNKATSATNLTNAKTDLSVKTTGSNATSEGRMTAKQLAAQQSLRGQIGNANDTAVTSAMATVHQSPLTLQDSSGNNVMPTLTAVNGCNAGDGTPTCAGDQSHLANLTPENWSTAHAQKMQNQAAFRATLFQHQNDLLKCKQTYESQRFDDTHQDQNPSTVTLANQPAACSVASLAADGATIATYKQSAQARYDAWNNKQATKTVFDAKAALANEPVNKANEQKRILGMILKNRAANDTTCSDLDGYDFTVLDGFTSATLSGITTINAVPSAAIAQQNSQLFCNCDAHGNNCRVDGSKFANNGINKTATTLGCPIDPITNVCATSTVTTTETVRAASGACVIDPVTNKCSVHTISYIKSQSPAATTKATVKTGAKVAYY